MDEWHAHAAISELKRLVESGIFSRDGAQSIFFKPSITMSLILMSDLLKLLDKNNCRLSTKKDLFIGKSNAGLKIRDLTDLVINCRSAACHIASKNNIFMRSEYNYMVFIGRHNTQNLLAGIGAGNPYEDDIVVCWGSLMLLVKRNFLFSYEFIVRHSHVIDSSPTNFSNK